MAPITAYVPADDGSGRTVMRIVYDDGRVWTWLMPVVGQGLMQGAGKGGKRLTQSRGVDSYARSAR